MTDSLKKTPRSRLKRRPGRGSFEREAVNAVLDAGLICHVGYVIDGAPLVTPTLHWRMGDKVFWHGSAASRALRTQAAGGDVCLTVTLLDGLVMARSAFHHSVNYRSAMLFGRAHKLEDRGEQMVAMEGLLDRVAPGRWQDARPPTDKELKATLILWMAIEEGAAKVRSGPPIDDAEDMSIPCWAGVVPVAPTLGKPVPDPLMKAGVAPPPYLGKIRTA